ncbi:tyrosine-type recombinase/integrase [Archaeoglobus sp.]
MNFHPNQRLSKALDNFKKSCPESYELVFEFASDLIAEGISEIRVRTYVAWLKKIVQVAGRDLCDFRKTEVKKVINHYQLLKANGDVSDSSVFEVKKTLKKFFKWYGREELVSWFSVGDVKNKLSPMDLITEEEFQRMMDACTNSRDRAFISLLYESGARIGEIGSMRIKDVSFDEYGAVVWLPRSKTVRRKLRVVYSSRYLAEWIADHPLKNDLEAPLWIKLTGKRRLQAVEYKDVHAQLKKIAKRAGIKKRIYPHLFRHTRATRLLAKVPESVGAKYMGWVPGSDMVRVYVHLASEDVDEAILQLHGIKTNGNGQDLEVKQCPRCLMVNPTKSRFCSRCGLPLTEDAVLELENWEKRKAEAMKKMTDPEFLRVFMSLNDEVQKLKEEIERLRAERK